MEFRAVRVHRHDRPGRGGGCVGIGSSGGKASDAYSHWRSVSQTATRIRLTSATPLCGLDRRNQAHVLSRPAPRGTLLDVRHVVPDDLHEVERNLSLVATLGHALAPGDDGRLAVERPECDLPGGLQRPYVVVHPGASVPARAWSVDGHRGVVAALLAAGWQVAVTGGREEGDLTGAVAGGHESGVMDLGGRTTFAELANVLAAAEAVVVGNTGAAHLAVAGRHASGVGVRPDGPGESMAAVASASRAARRPVDRLRRLPRPAVPGRRSSVRGRRDPR